MKRLQLLTIVLAIFSSYVWAQRPTDKLGRGLVAVKTDAGVFLSWRILGEEYYDVNYNVYRDGTRINSTPLSLSNFVDKGGSYGNTYTVSAVVRGVEQDHCKAVSVWSQYKYKLNTTCETGYFNIPLARVYNNSGQDITNTYIANDAEVADLDGDGEMEIILKRRSTLDDGADYVSRTDGAYDRIDAYKMDGTLLWWIDVGPNMVSGGSHELNIIAYDWDGDGKAEVLLRGADNMMVHGQRGASRQEWPQRIGKNGVDTRGSINHTANMTYTNTGDEFLVYMDGDHGIIYDAVRYMSYPIPRGKASDWGDSYGHRSSKYFMGAPFLDGKKPSILLARGIYTKHEMRAFDVDPVTHTLTERWHWSNNGGWNDPWYGNGNHNFCIADVDEDGRDEIVYGSMVVDDNGHGLSTTGLGHGDALHCSDFDPYRKGLEIFACNEDEPAMNYRNATTSKIYYRQTSSSDDGRALCANFSNVYPGAMGRSTQTGMVSCVKDAVISDIGDYIAWSDLNFRIYWDGDLLSEVLNSPGTEREAAVIKPGSGRLFTSSGCKMNNWSKNHPCFSGDILGDWREEMILRVGEGHDSIRIYTTAMPTNYPIYTLWHDHQYRQAMVWQMHAYNQPPHLSYFLGEMEGITVPPPPLTTTNRTVIGNGTTINSSYNNQHILHNEYANTSLNVTDGASPYILTVNVPVWIQGADSYIVSNANVNTVGYSCNLNGGALTGSMRLIKQGNGTLNMAKVNHTFTGETNIWGGTVNFDGSLKSSKVWMNRFTTLNSDGGLFPGAFVMEYGATLNVGGEAIGSIGSITTGDMILNYGARVVLDINGSGDNEHDWLNATSLTLDVDKLNNDKWVNFGPSDIVPVIVLNIGGSLGNGLYPLGNISRVNGDLSKVKMECYGMDAKYLSLVHQDGKLYMKVSGLPTLEPATIEIVDMAQYGGMTTIYPATKKTDYYLPVVGVKNTSVNGQTPKLSGTFTSLDGTVKTIGSEEGEVVYSQNYESVSSITGWTSNGANISLGSGDATYGKYFYVNTGSTNTRYAYQRIDSINLSTANQYTIDFDLSLNAGNTDGSEFCVMAKNGNNPTTNWDNYAYINGNSNMLFDLTGNKQSTEYNVNGTSTTTKLNANTWYHVSLTVNQQARTVKWSISNGNSGTFNLPSGSSTEFDGFYLVAGRYYSVFKLDNIVVKTAAVDLSTYTFTEPGTLTIHASLGTSLSPSTMTFTAERPYYKLYDSPDYEALKVSEAASVLGWTEAPYGSRWAYWNKENATYGSNYQMVSSGQTSGYIDKDQMISYGYTGMAYVYHLVESFGIGHNTVGKYTPISIFNLRDDNTLVYHKINLSRGNALSYDEGFTNAGADGTWTYNIYENTTLCKVKVYLPVKVLIGDLNHDGLVNITDVVLLVNYVLGDRSIYLYKFEADLNGDGFVNITDVVTLTNIILNNE